MEDFLASGILGGDGEEGEGFSCEMCFCRRFEGEVRFSMMGLVFRERRR